MLQFEETRTRRGGKFAKELDERKKAFQAKVHAIKKERLRIMIEQKQNSTK